MQLFCTIKIIFQKHVKNVIFNGSGTKKWVNIAKCDIDPAMNTDRLIPLLFIFQICYRELLAFPLRLT